MEQPIKVFQEALKAHQAGAFKEAEKLYRKVLHQHPSHPASHRLLGTLLAQQGDYMAAEQHLRQALSLDPNDAETSNNLGIICSETERLDEAIACYERAITINPHFVSAWSNLGDALRSKGRLDDAEYALRRALNLDSGNIDALNNLGILFQEQGRNVAALEAFQAVLDLDRHHEKTLFNKGQLLRKLGHYAEAEACYRQLLNINPGYVSARVNLAVLLTDKGQYGEAESLLLRVLKSDPKHAVALCNLANLRRCQGNHAGALDLYARVLEQNPNDAQALSGLGVALFEQGSVEEGLHATHKALALRPFFADAYVNLGYIQTKLGRYTEALANYQHALCLEPGNVHARLNRAINLLLLGYYEEGWGEYESRFTAQPYNCPGTFLSDVPSWDGSSWDGMWLFVFAEQGYGDTLQFVRFFPELKARGIKILFACQAPLIRLLQEHADLVISPFEKYLPHQPDYQVPLLSLPRILSIGLEAIPNDIPYVSPPEMLVCEWRERLRAIVGIKVGLVWAGSPTHKNDHNRSIPLAQLTPLLEVEGISFVSLQLGSAAIQALSVPKANPLVDLTGAITDFADTAALIANLDLVISVDTSVAHLTGAMGKPVWVLLPFAPDWRWLLDREDSPWYPTMRLFRQPKVGDWETVVRAVAAALERRELNPVVMRPRANPDAGSGCFRTLKKSWRGEAPPVPKGGSGTYAAKLRLVDETERRKAVIAEQRTDIERWSDPSQLEPAWDTRAEVASQFVPMGAHVVDLGCGAMALERFLPAGCSYQPVDVVQRDARTIVCDLNRRELPENALAKADVISMLGVLEYLYDLPTFLARLATFRKPAIVSYCPLEFTSQLDRAALGWVNHYDLKSLVQQILTAGFSVQRIEKIDRFQVMLRLKPRQSEQPRPRRVLVLSYNNIGNFGDRLGFHLVHQVLPAHAVVTHANFHPWNIPDEAFDLLVLGVGNSLFAPLLTEQLLRLLDRVPSSVGIFGTQYRKGFHPSRLSSVLSRLDHWFARYEEDALLYGKGYNHVSHLGDWLIDAFPMTRWQQDKILDIGQEVWDDLPLDRVIQKIQLFRKVNSTRLHPLLCALTSAESVAYAEQRETTSDTPSGKFRSMLIDVFGKELPEGRFWDVDRDAVLAYKRKVADGVAQLRALLYQRLS